MRHCWDFIPWNGETSTMRTEDGIRSVFYVSNWIIINISNNIFSIMTWIIASNNKLELTLP